MKRLWLAGIAFAALLCPSPDHATTIIQQSLVQLVDEAPVILVANTLHQRVEMPAGAISPTTLVTFLVTDVLKGRTQDTELTVAFEGGEWKEEVFEVIGMPTFEVGGRYLLFLGHNGAAGGCPIIGWWQGKFELVRHPLGGHEILVDHRGLPVAGIAGDSWSKAEVRIDENGLLRSLATAGIEIEEEDGVTISGLPDPEANPEDSLATVPEAQQILSSLGELVQQRNGLSSFRSGETLRSADLETRVRPPGSHPQPILPDDVPAPPQEIER